MVGVTTAAMADLEYTGNIIEAGFWFFVSLAMFANSLRSTRELKQIYFLLGAGFLAFGISDWIEAHTGAWWRPIWLLLLKIACVAIFVFGFRAYFRLVKKNLK